MSEVITPIIKVDVGESQQTVKGLKKEITDLKDRILNLTKGSDEYNAAVEELQDNQRKLNEVMALTKKEAVAVEGSYDALVHKMSQLKKEWRATADEAKRAEIGAEIGKINAQLKELDAEIGNYQRNVGNYVSHWEGMPEVTKDFGAAMREMNESIEPTKQKFEAVGKISSGLASGFAVVQGSMALLGVESDNLEQTFVKLQAAMALMQGVKGIGDLVEGVGKAKVAFEGLGTKIKAVTKAMGTTGWIAVIMLVITAIAGLVSWIKKTKDNSEELEKSLEKLSEKHKQIGSNVGNAVGQFKLLQRQFSELKKADKQKWIDENAQAFSSLGLAITDVNDANKIFLENSDKIIEALKLQAEAAALNSIYQQAYGEAYAKKRDIDARKKLYTAGYNPTDEEEEGAGLSGTRDFQTYTYTATSNYGSTGTYATTTLSTVNAEGAKKLADYADKQKEAIDAEVNAILEEFVELQNKAEGAVSALGGLVTKPNDKGKPKTFEELLAEVQQSLYDSAVNMVIEDVKLDIEDSTKSTGYQYKDGDAEKRYGFWNNIIDKETSNAVRRSKLDGGTPEEQDALLIKGEERKLAKLKEFWEQARKEGDVTGELALRQQIAEQELTIEEEKNRAILESEERTKEKRLQIMNEISNALSAAGSVTQGILEITQAAAEKDGKITEKEAKRIKGMQYATATINMLQGAVSAFSAAQSIPPPFGQIIGAANAAAVIAMGTANLMKIKNTDLTGSVPSGAMGAVTPNSNVFGTDVPFSYTQNVTGQSEIDSLNQDTKVYILESDLQTSNKKVQMRENESSF